MKARKDKEDLHSKFVVNNPIFPTSILSTSLFWFRQSWSQKKSSKKSNPYTPTQNETSKTTSMFDADMDVSPSRDQYSDAFYDIDAEVFYQFTVATINRVQIFLKNFLNWSISIYVVVVQWSGRRFNCGNTWTWAKVSGKYYKYRQYKDGIYSAQIRCLNKALGCEE